MFNSETCFRKLKLCAGEETGEQEQSSNSHGAALAFGHVSTTTLLTLHHDYLSIDLPISSDNM